MEQLSQEVIDSRLYDLEIKYTEQVGEGGAWGLSKHLSTEHGLTAGELLEAFQLLQYEAYAHKGGDSSRYFVLDAGIDSYYGGEYFVGILKKEISAVVDGLKEKRAA